MSSAFLAAFVYLVMGCAIEMASIFMLASCSDAPPGQCLSCDLVCLRETHDPDANRCADYGFAIYVHPPGPAPEDCYAAGVTELGVERYCCRYAPTTCLPIRGGIGGN